MKCLVTGSSGFIGTHLVKTLLRKKYEVEGIDKHSSLFHNENTHFMDISDVTNVSKLKKIIHDFDFVFHLAGLLGTNELIDNSYLATMVNIGGTINILEACKQTRTKIIFISKPNCWLNAYSITKQASEEFIKMYRQEYGLQAVILKWFNVYGLYQPLLDECGYKKLIPHVIVNTLKNKEIEIYGTGTQLIDLIHTTDAINAMFAIINNWDKCEGSTFEAGHHVISVNDTVNMIYDLIGNKPKIIYLPMRKGEPENSKIMADTTLLTQKTGWEQRTPLKDGLNTTIDWYNESYNSNL